MRNGPPRGVVAAIAVVLWLATGPAPATSAARVPAKGHTTIARATGSFGATSPTLSFDELAFRIDVTTKELRVATDEYDQLDRELVRASTETDELRVETAQVAEETLRNAIEGYRHSEIPRGILGAADVTSSMRATALGGAAVSSDVDSFNAYRTLRKDLEIEEAALVEREAVTADAEARMSRLEARLNDELIRYGDLVERRLQDDAVLISVQAANRAQARGRKQGFFLDTCPVNGRHSFIDSWGFARSGGRRHKGVDVLAAPGTPIVAPVSGRVEHFSNSVGGRSFRLFDANGNYFYGTHLSGFAKQGLVSAGEVIGYVGDDGNAAGIPHLHFEIHPGGRGRPINPFIDTAAVCSGAR